MGKADASFELLGGAGLLPALSLGIGLSLVLRSQLLWKSTTETIQNETLAMHGTHQPVK